MRLKSIPVTQVADEYALVLPDTKSSKKHLLVLNNTSLLLWKQLQDIDFEENDAIRILLDSYDVTECLARSDVQKWLVSLKVHNLLKE